MDRISRLCRKEIWSSSVPIQFSLAKEDLHPDQKSPHPLFLLVPRVSFLPSVGTHLLDHFRSFTTTPTGKIWFSCDGAPLRWHLPVGVLFDLSFGGGQSVWQVRVHFSEFPDGKILAWETEKDIRATFINSIKQSAQLLYGSTKTLMRLSGTDEEILWDAVSNANLSEYEQIEPLLRASGEEDARSVGIRIHMRDKPSAIMRVDLRQAKDEDRGTEGDGVGDGQDSVKYGRTLADVLTEWMPTWSGSVVLHGQTIDPEKFSIRFLRDVGAYPDLLIHICVVNRDGCGSK